MSMINEKLETFNAVCETKSFTKAAEKLSLTQPAVSQHIKKLEEELNATLFLRKKYHRLTRANSVLTGRNAPIPRQAP